MHELRSNLVRGEARDPVSHKSGRRRGAGSEGGSLAGIRIRRDEARKVDQRREDRHLNVVDTATLLRQRRSCEASVLNVSARGAMVASDLVPRIGERIDIQFAGCNRTACSVRWIRNGRIGLEFDKETLVIGGDVHERLVGGRREGEHPTLAVKGERPPRQRLILRGVLHWHDGSMSVRLRNISADGAMLEGSDDLAPPAPVVLELPDGVAVEGEVRWCRSRQIGIRFAAPFDLEQLVRAHEPDKQQPDYLKPDYLKSDGAEDSPWFARRTGLTADDL